MLAIVELAAEIADEASRTSSTRTTAARSSSTGAGSSWSPPGTPRSRPRARRTRPPGLLIHYGDHLIYHLGDTALFSDLKLIAQRGDKVDLALVPIGGHFTMDRYDAVTAVELINPQQVIPIHYGTFPPIETDAQAFKSDVQNAGFSEVVVLEPGDTHTVR